MYELHVARMGKGPRNGSGAPPLSPPLTCYGTPLGDEAMCGCIHDECSEGCGADDEETGEHDHGVGGGQIRLLEREGGGR